VIEYWILNRCFGAGMPFCGKNRHPKKEKGRGYFLMGVNLFQNLSVINIERFFRGLGTSAQ
jgi:hypothetical protein